MTICDFCRQSECNGGSVHRDLKQQWSHTHHLERHCNRRTHHICTCSDLSLTWSQGPAHTRMIVFPSPRAHWHPLWIFFKSSFYIPKFWFKSESSISSGSCLSSGMIIPCSFFFQSFTSSTEWVMFTVHKNHFHKNDPLRSFPQKWPTHKNNSQVHKNDPLGEFKFVTVIIGLHFSLTTQITASMTRISLPWMYTLSLSLDLQWQGAFVITCSSFSVLWYIVTRGVYSESEFQVGSRKGPGEGRKR